MPSNRAARHRTVFRLATRRAWPSGANMRLLFLAVWLSACGPSSYRCDVSSVGYCVEFGSGTTEATARATCAQQEQIALLYDKTGASHAVFGLGACKTSERVGSCAAASGRTVFYSTGGLALGGGTADGAKDYCALAGGTFEP